MMGKGFSMSLALLTEMIVLLNGKREDKRGKG